MNKLNLFKPQMKVKIKDFHTGEFYEATINSSADWGIEPQWWITYVDKNGVIDTTLASEAELIEWNFAQADLNTIKCTCGSVSVGHPGHAYHCLLTIHGLIKD